MAQLQAGPNETELRETAEICATNSKAAFAADVLYGVSIVANSVGSMAGLYIAGQTAFSRTAWMVCLVSLTCGLIALCGAYMITSPWFSAAGDEH